jgi:hypothetical protein
VLPFTIGDWSIISRPIAPLIALPSLTALNWIQTVGGRNFLVALRLYGTGVEFFDQTWKPDDVVRVK